jgi:hypothetical protein
MRQVRALAFIARREPAAMWASRITAHLGPVVLDVLSAARSGLAAVSRSPAAARARSVSFLVFTSGIGLFVVAIGDARARSGIEPSEPLFWLGLLVLFVPVAWALWAKWPNRTQRIALVILLGLGLYLVKILHSPSGFTFYDEFSHWRTAADILATDHLFAPNPLQPISSHYPGLEVLTAALSDLSGLPLDRAGILVIGLGRLLLMLALFLLFERLAGSPRRAGVAVLLYSASPSFVFFHAQFSYESLAFPLAAAALYALAACSRAAPDVAKRTTIIALLIIAAVVPTHHVTSYILAGALVGWAVIGRLRPDPALAQMTPTRPAIFAVVATAAWLALVAWSTLGYLGPHLIGGLDELLRVITGQTSGRRLFEDETGLVAPMWERAVGYGAVILILGGLVPGLKAVWRLYRRQPLALTLALAALGYPVSLALRFTSRGVESGARLSAFLFVAIAFALAAWAVGARRKGWRWRRPALLAAVSVIFLGGVIVGFAPWARLPLPYRPAADSRSIEAHGLAAADWARTHLGAGRRFAADRTNRQLLGSYGRQDPVTQFGNSVDTAGLLLSPTMGQDELAAVLEGQVEFVITDIRLTTMLPLAGLYVESGEPGQPRDRPLELAAIEKFDLATGVARIFDDGSLRIYDFRGIDASTPR